MKANPAVGRAVLFAVAAFGACIGASNAAESDSRSAAQCRTIRANQAWQGTGITVTPGQFVCVAADGLWSHGGQGIQAITPFYGPEGFAKDDPVDIPEVVSRIGALVGRIGGNAPFVIERQLCFIPAAPGELTLSMNDSPGTFGNNAGVMHVQVATWPSTSIPRRINLQAQECRAR
jgi:hypothetical protein